MIHQQLSVALIGQNRSRGKPLPKNYSAYKALAFKIVSNFFPTVFQLRALLVDRATSNSTLIYN